MNSFILLLHITTVCGLTLAALRFGKEMMAAWLGLLAATMNFFVLKQINLFGLSVTASDALTVGYLLGLNLTQEFFGSEQTRKSVWISLFLTGAFLALSHIHLAYIPNRYDTTQGHFVTLLAPMPRVILASLLSFCLVQFLDLAVFKFLKKRVRSLPLRTFAALCISQLCDTLLFSYIGLYGIVASVTHIIVFSLAIKGVVIALSSPFAALSKKVVRV